MRIHESAENYLETILILKSRLGAVRSIDVVNELEYSKPSVSVAMKNLRESGYVLMDEGGFLTLTESGMRIAESMYERHTILSSYLISLGVDEKTAAEDACRIEHVISEQSFEKIREHIRHFWSKGYSVSTVGSNKQVIRDYTKTQEEADMIEDGVNP